jgi:hypothetical protein
MNPFARMISAWPAFTMAAASAGMWRKVPPSGDCNSTLA